MDVILLKKFDDLGKAGDIVSVSRGYARNFLIPQGYAAQASESNLQIMKEAERLQGQVGRKLKKVAEGYSTRFKDVSCTISVQASDDDKLYGSVGGREIATALAELGYEIEPRQVVLEEPVKQLGVYTVPIRLHEEVEVSVKVWVVKAES